MSEAVLVPKLRFSEFSGEWEENKLGDVSTNIMYGIGSAATKYDGVNKYLRITDINDSSRNFVPKPLTSPEGFINDSYKLNDGDIVFARTGASVGKSYLYKASDGNLIFAGFLIKFNISNADPYFVYSNTFRSTYDNWVSVMSVRSGQPGLNAEEYKLLPISLPTKPEQQKIASFLTAVDTKIEQLCKKKELLGEYKKGLMQQIFSQAIRFHPKSTSSQAQGEIDDGSVFPDWEEGKLGDIATFSRGKGVSKSDIDDDGQLECIRYGELYTTYNELIKDIYSRTNLAKEDVNLSQNGDVIIPASGETAIDIATASCVLKDDVAIGGDLNIIRSDMDGIFFAYYLNNKEKYNIARLSQGSSVIHLYSKHLKTLKINLPSKPEQTKIANFLSSIDNKIEQVGKQLDESKQFKKALLQQMFV